MAESGRRWIERWREGLASADPPVDPAVWGPVVRAGPDPARMYDVLAAELLRTRPELVARLGERPPPLPPRARRPRSWSAGRLGLAIGLAVAATVLLVLAPLWLREEPRSDAVYFVMVDRFADARPDPPGTVDKSDPQGWHGGDLAGILAHLDHLEALGVGALWLTPVSEARYEKHGPWGAYHGYWVHRLDTVDPRFGSLDELRELSDALHARGMKLYLDLVYNHVGPDAPLHRTRRDWFHNLGDIRNWDDPVEIVTHDVHGLPDLAQEHEEVYAHLRDASLALVDAVDPDGFRVDAVRHLPAGFLARLGEELRARKPGFELIGEIFDGNADRVAARAAVDELDAVFDFPLYFALRDTVCDGAPAGRLATALLADYGRARPITLADNHDLPRILSACRGERAWSAVALVTLSRGTPSITWGTEAGLEGAKEPENRADMDFDADHPLGDAVEALLDLRAEAESVRSGLTRVVGLSDDALVMARIGARETTVVSYGTDASWAAVDHRTAQGRGGGTVRGEEVDRFGQVAVARFAAAPPVSRVPVRLELRVDGPPGLRVVGGGAALGRWDPGQGAPVVDGVARIEVPDGSVLGFKLVAVGPDGSVEWEPGADRFLLVTSDRWTGPGPCGSRCAPVEAGVARHQVRWGTR